MQCEFCGGWAEELARTRNHLWFGCHDCQRSWKDDIQAALNYVKTLPTEGAEALDDRVEGVPVFKQPAPAK